MVDDPIRLVPDTRTASGLDRERSTVAFAAMVRLVRIVDQIRADRLDSGKTLSMNNTRGLGMVRQ